MSFRDVLLLWGLAAIWGGSFLFLRMAVPEFGPIAIIQVRVTIAALCLMPLVLLWHRQELHWRGMGHIVFVGLTNSALPFCLLAYATVHLTAGFTSILNSTVPFWTAVVGWLWLRESLNRWQQLGLVIGTLGVAYLAEAKTGLSWSGPTLAVLSGLLATLSYGISANYTRVYLGDVKPLIITALSMSWAAVALLPFTLVALPETLPSARAWLAVLLLGVVCTAFAYIHFYKLIARVGATQTVTVTYLVPVFGTLWGGLFLDESVSLTLLIGGGIILLGTSLTLGLIRPDRWFKPRSP